MPELVVELLAMIDIEEEQAQRFAAFRRGYGCLAQNAVEHLAIAETGQGIHQGLATRSVEF